MDGKKLRRIFKDYPWLEQELRGWIDRPLNSQDIGSVVIETMDKQWHLGDIISSQEQPAEKYDWERVNWVILFYAEGGTVLRSRIFWQENRKLTIAEVSEQMDSFYRATEGGASLVALVKRVVSGCGNIIKPVQVTVFLPPQ